MDIWAYFADLIGVVVPGALTIALGALIVWGANTLRKRVVGTKADFILHRRGGEQYELEYQGRKPAFEVRQGDGIESGSENNPMSGVSVGDMTKGQRRMLGMPNNTGCYVWFNWIAGGSRYYTKSAYVEPGTGDIEFLAIRRRAGETYQT